MALTNEHIGLRRYHEEIEYGFFGENGAISDAVAPGVPWKLRTVKIHVSSKFLSVEYLVLKLSSGLRSEYNTVLYSANFSDTQDLFIYYSEPIPFLSDDQLLFELSTVSGVNVIGFQFDTWAARG